MKEISTLLFPEDLLYAEDHEWTRIENETLTIGIDDYAQDRLGDIVFVELPREGDTFGRGEEFGTVESVKAVSELYMPVGGEVISVNTDLEDSPERINQSPYGDGWLIRVRPDNEEELDLLMKKEAYITYLEGKD
ncbi:MAG: glycine cleavage system protein GcvH [Syntrophales bacterium]|jgi:glycine cleavage system H protein|nr:glycine cleavage system protein GcvH [Syntrophales bacterium]MCK9527320.1 glycine cleavage system protein GcvH [Syntrophales bacterium]MDX9921210.1 glycine cleavage system protein GcvH [Syntrophales bacterium]